jgi:hypothetical protein
MIMHCLRTAGCPSAERNLLTGPTGGATPVLTPLGVDSPLVQLRHSGRADALKRRRKVRDDFLGREGKPSQSPIRKARRQTLNSCLVQPALEVDASFLNELLASVSRASSSNGHEKNWIIQSPSGVRPLDFRDHIAVRPASLVTQACHPRRPGASACPRRLHRRQN